MNCLCVVNIHDCLGENSRASLAAAASRWGADFMEMTEHDRPYLYPSFAKAGVPSRLQQYERLACFDADMLIRSDAPSCFDTMANVEKLYAVRDLSFNRPHVPRPLRRSFIRSVRIPYFQPLAGRIGRAVDINRYLDNFFNTGFFLCSPRRHRTLFEFIVSHFPGESDRYRGLPHYEQALFNYCAQLLAADDLELVDETWNYLDPDLSSPVMSKYVYHFTGATYEVLKRSIGSFSWKAHGDC